MLLAYRAELGRICPARIYVIALANHTAPGAMAWRCGDRCAHELHRGDMNRTTQVRQKAQKPPALELLPWANFVYLNTHGHATYPCFPSLDSIDMCTRRASR